MSQKVDSMKEASMEEETDVGGIDARMASVVAYLVAPVSSLMVFVMEENNEFVRFHAMQALIFSVLSWVIITVTSAVFIGLLFVPLYYVVIAFLCYKAYNGEAWEIPGIGGFAYEQI